MNKVIHRESNAWGRTSTIILAGGFAFVMVTVVGDETNVAVIHDLVVHESRRGKGLGRKLLNEALNEALNLGAYVIRLSVEPGTWVADWYFRNGFAPSREAEFGGHRYLVMEKDNSQ